MARTITGANAVIILTVPGVFVVPQQLQGFAVDDVFSTERQAPVEATQGVDGQGASGFQFQQIKQGFMFQANSVSIDIFDQWWSFMQVVRDSFEASGVISLAAVQKKWVMTGGSLTGYTPIPNTGRMLKQRDFEITWNQIIPQPF